MTTRRAAVVHNPLRLGRTRLDRIVNREEARAGWATSVRVATRPGEAAADLRARILAEPVDVVVAAGGDGTVQAVAEAIADDDVALALWPVGSTNLLARNLGLSVLDPASGLRAAFGTNERRIDTGRVDFELTDGIRHRRTFVVLAGFGVDAQMVVHTSDDAKAQLGWLAYVKGATLGVTRPDRFSITYQLDDGERQRARLHTFAIGNGGVLPAGLTFLPDTRIDDGELDVLMLSPEGVRGWRDLAHWFVRENATAPRAWNRRRRRRSRPNPDGVRQERVRRVRLRIERGEDFQIDGEYLGKVVALQATVHPSALRVRVPAPGTWPLSLPGAGARPESVAPRIDYSRPSRVRHRTSSPSPADESATPD